MTQVLKQGTKQIKSFIHVPLSLMNNDWWGAVSGCYSCTSSPPCGDNLWDPFRLKKFCHSACVTSWHKQNKRVTWWQSTKQTRQNKNTAQNMWLQVWRIKWTCTVAICFYARTFGSVAGLRCRALQDARHLWLTPRRHPFSIKLLDAC